MTDAERKVVREIAARRGGEEYAPGGWRFPHSRDCVAALKEAMAALPAVHFWSANDIFGYEEKTGESEWAAEVAGKRTRAT